VRFTTEQPPSSTIGTRDGGTMRTPSRAFPSTKQPGWFSYFKENMEALGLPIPASIYGGQTTTYRHWIPACAGMTGKSELAQLPTLPLPARVPSIHVA
jgi:hypothetical protein